MKKLSARVIAHSIYKSSCMDVNDDDGNLVFISHGIDCMNLTEILETFAQQEFETGWDQGYQEGDESN